MDIEERNKHMEKASEISEKIARKLFIESLQKNEKEPKKKLSDEDVKKIVEIFSKPHDAGHPVSEHDEK